MIAIDPGESAGRGRFDRPSRKLLECGLIDSADRLALRTADVVCEHPTIYPGTKNPNNIVTLAITAGRLVERHLALDGVLKWHLPRQWKGQVPKPPKAADYIIYRRIVNALDADERQIFAQALAQVGSEKAKLDIIDAVGLGLFDLKRLR